MSWQRTLGACPDGRGTHFRVWAPDRASVELVVERPGSRIIPLSKEPDGLFCGYVPTLSPGALYRYQVDGLGPFPDPASRFQPEGVHGPSEIIDPARFAWTDQEWRAVPREELVIYELHVGTFSREGSFDAVTPRLPQLAELGVTAIELLPVADFPGDRNWGYDGVNLFAPARCYGRPDDLRRLVDEAHRLGLAVLLDVVYNHLGPDGNYLAQFSRHYFSERHKTLWGPAINLDGRHSQAVRAYLFENALHWLCEYHLDGLRLDATHYLFDESPRHFLAELSAIVSATITDRAIHLIAEDPRNLAFMVRPGTEGGWGLDALWSDDFHHDLRRYLVGDVDGAFRDFRGRLDDLALTINRGWLFCGAYSIHRGYNRGTDPAGLDPSRFVFFIQNHDRIGNRAFGERLNHQVSPAAFRAASALLLLAPQIPLLFMGQEWASSAPFLFFTDHAEPLGTLVKEGRRREFRDYVAFTDPEALKRIPDCQAESTFFACKLDWTESDREPHASILRLYRTLLHLRRTEPALQCAGRDHFEATALDADTLVVRRDADHGSSLWLVVHFEGPGTFRLNIPAASSVLHWKLLLTTEDPSFAAEPGATPPNVDLTAPVPTITFTSPAAVILRASRSLETLVT
jgi:maltooligosyltrehalose trehalohydrolase